MSSGEACNCVQRRVSLAARRWRVLQRRCNHSAFNGYRYTPSRHSSILCLFCGASWRTSAKYVDRLSNLSTEEESAFCRGEGTDHGPA